MIILEIDYYKIIFQQGQFAEKLKKWNDYRSKEDTTLTTGNRDINNK